MRTIQDWVHPLPTDQGRGRGGSRPASGGFVKQYSRRRSDELRAFGIPLSKVNRRHPLQQHGRRRSLYRDEWQEYMVRADAPICAAYRI